MTKNILRTAIATVIGVVVAFGLIWLAQYAGSEISPDVYVPPSGEVLIPIGLALLATAGIAGLQFARSRPDRAIPATVR